MRASRKDVLEIPKRKNGVYQKLIYSIFFMNW